MPLDDTISTGQSGHITDHQTIAQYLPLRSRAGGRWYFEPSGPVTTLTLTAGRLYAVPLDLGSAETIDRLSIDCTTAGTDASVVRLGVYADADDVPGSLLVDGGTVSTLTTGAKAVTISQAVGPGRCWLVAVAQGATTTQPTLRSVGSTTNNSAVASASNANGYVGYLSASSVTGALPASFGTPGEGSGPPSIAVRFV